MEVKVPGEMKAGLFLIYLCISIETESSGKEFAT